MLALKAAAEIASTLLFLMGVTDPMIVLLSQSFITFWGFQRWEGQGCMPHFLCGEAS
jgi:hypothetical protein